MAMGRERSTAADHEAFWPDALAMATPSEVESDSVIRSGGDGRSKRPEPVA